MSLEIKVTHGMMMEETEGGTCHRTSKIPLAASLMSTATGRASCALSGATTQYRRMNALKKWHILIRRFCTLLQPGVKFDVIALDEVLNVSLQQLIDIVPAGIFCHSLSNRAELCICAIRSCCHLSKMKSKRGLKRT